MLKVILVIEIMVAILYFWGWIVMLEIATLIGGIAASDYFVEGKIRAYLALIVRWPLKMFRSKSFSLEEPEDTVPLNSKFYVERPPIESDCYKKIVQNGALIRIKAPQQMGKTSLMTRILEHAEQQKNYRIAQVLFSEADKKFFADIEPFLRWFCISVTSGLNLPNKLDEYWNGTHEGSKYKCKSYFQRYLLPSCNSPVVLGLDKVEQVLQYPEIANEFFGLLRAWHERGQNEPIWKKLRIVIAHSKDVYISLDTNYSPYNLGTSIELPELNQLQVRDLVRRHKLGWKLNWKLNWHKPRPVEQLMMMVGGHPYLVRIALEKIARERMTLEELLKAAPTERGPYSNHLRGLFNKLKGNTNLAKAFQKVITAKQSIPSYEVEEAFQLHSMGLIKFQDDDTVTPLCDLYSLYFHNRINSVTNSIEN